VPVTLPILAWPRTAGERMSKSKGKTISASTTPPTRQYGKTMSLPDGVLMDFYVLATTPAG